MLKVGVIQQACWPDKEKSLAETERLIKEIASHKVELILLQELHATQYFCQTEELSHFDLAEPLDGPTTKFLGKLAKQYNCVIVGSIFEKLSSLPLSYVAVNHRGYKDGYAVSPNETIKGISVSPIFTITKNKAKGSENKLQTAVLATI